MVEYWEMEREVWAIRDVYGELEFFYGDREALLAYLEG